MLANKLHTCIFNELFKICGIKVYNEILDNYKKSLLAGLPKFLML